MKNILTITRLTFYEALARKNFIMFFALSCLALIIIGIIFSLLGVNDFSGMVNINTDEMPNMSLSISSVFKLMIVIPLFGGGLFLSIFSVSSFIPQMLEKGNIDVLLSKPISRTQLIYGKFVGGLSVVFVNVAFLVIGIWLLIGIKFGRWDADFLLTIFTITFTFAVLYSLIIFIGILSQSSVLAMMLSYMIFFILSPVLLARDKIMMLIDSKIIGTLLDGLYYIVPKTSELGRLTADLAKGMAVQDYQPLISSFIFMILTLAGGIIIFNKKDY